MANQRFTGVVNMPDSVMEVVNSASNRDMVLSIWGSAVQNARVYASSKVVVKNAEQVFFNNSVVKTIVEKMEQTASLKTRVSARLEKINASLKTTATTMASAYRKAVRMATKVVSDIVTDIKTISSLRCVRKNTYVTLKSAHYEWSIKESRRYVLPSKVTQLTYKLGDFMSFVVGTN